MLAANRERKRNGNGSNYLLTRLAVIGWKAYKILGRSKDSWISSTDIRTARDFGAKVLCLVASVERWEISGDVRVDQRHSKASAHRRLSLFRARRLCASEATGVVRVFRET